MLKTPRERIASKLLSWSSSLMRLSATSALDRSTLSVLVFFHGGCPVHARRAGEIGRQLSLRGYKVRLAGSGPYAEQLFQVRPGTVSHPVKTLPLEVHRDQCALFGYRTSDTESINSCVESERSLIAEHKPDLVIHSLKPTVSIAAHLEGVDEVEVIQGYEQPGYSRPFQLTSSAPQRDMFSQYLNSKAGEIRRRTKYYLIADLPEVHPTLHFDPGTFNHIGPLLSPTGGRKQRGSAEKGKGARPPVVYLKGGPSSLRRDLVRQAQSGAKPPYHLLVESMGDVVESRGQVEFLGNASGELPWERMTVIVGDLDTDMLYLALSHRVFSIGIATNLEKEIQLERFETLNLGAKVDPDRLDWYSVNEILQSTLGTWERVEAKLDQYGKLIDQWSDGDVLSQWVDDYFSHQHTPLRYDARFLMREDEFLEQLEGTTPPTMSRRLLQKLLRQGTQRGLPHWRQGNQYFFDRIDSWNWLYEREPRFFELEYKACDARRRRFFGGMDATTTSSVFSRSHTQHYRVTYSHEVYLTEEGADQQVRVFLPYPLETRHQRAVELLGCSPLAMEEYLRSSFGFLFAYPCVVGSTPRTFSYTCDLEIDEQSPDVGGRALPKCERGRYLQVDEALARVPELDRLVLEIRERNACRSDRELAEAFYRYLVENKKFRKTKVPARGLADASAYLLNSSGGNCIHFARTFMALCRTVGIPSREKCGALLGYPHSDQVYECWSIDEPIVGHTWAEIHLEEAGWMPVEFHSVTIGERCSSAYNTTDPELKSYIESNTRAFDSYYFGHLDNQRLTFSNSARDFVPCLGEGADGWKRVPGLRCKYRLRMECT